MAPRACGGVVVAGQPCGMDMPPHAARAKSSTKGGNGRVFRRLRAALHRSNRLPGRHAATIGARGSRFHRGVEHHRLRCRARRGTAPSADRVGREPDGRHRSASQSARKRLRSSPSRVILSTTRARELPSRRSFARLSSSTRLGARSSKSAKARPMNGRSAAHALADAMVSTTLSRCTSPRANWGHVEDGSNPSRASKRSTASRRSREAGNRVGELRQSVRASRKRSDARRTIGTGARPSRSALGGASSSSMEIHSNDAASSRSSPDAGSSEAGELARANSNLSSFMPSRQLAAGTATAYSRHSGAS